MFCPIGLIDIVSTAAVNTILSTSNAHPLHLLPNTYRSSSLLFGDYKINQFLMDLWDSARQRYTSISSPSYTEFSYASSSPFLRSSRWQESPWITQVRVFFFLRCFSLCDCERYLWIQSGDWHRKNFGEIVRSLFRRSKCGISVSGTVDEITCFGSPLTSLSSQAT